MSSEPSSYRQILKDALVERIGRNPAYSLRSMARQFGVSPALLSQIINGKRNLTASKAIRVSRQLGLVGKKREAFNLLVQYENAKDSETKALILEQLNATGSHRNLHSLSMDAFNVIADWYHYPIVQILRLKSFRATPRSISRRLGISSHEAEVALGRLVRLKIIERTERGVYRRLPISDLRAESEQKNDAIRKFHRQMLGKAIESLETQLPQEKYIGSETISIDLSQLPEAKRRIDEFLDEMVAFFDRGKNLTETYHLGTQLFRLTRKDKK